MAFWGKIVKNFNYNSLKIGRERIGSSSHWLYWCCTPCPKQGVKLPLFFWEYICECSAGYFTCFVSCLKYKLVIKPIPICCSVFAQYRTGQQSQKFSLFHSSEITPIILSIWCPDGWKLMAWFPAILRNEIYEHWLSASLLESNLRRRKKL